MKTKTVFIILLLFTAGLLAGEKKTIKKFALDDYNDTLYKISNYDDSKAIVLIFMSARCPVSNAYNKRMISLYNTYYRKGITFLGINSNKTENKEEIKKHAFENGFEFPILIDKDNKVADELNAQVTPEIFVVDSDLEILYHGRIDDSQNPDNIKSHDLTDALTAIVKNKPVPVTKTKAFGCSIKRTDMAGN